MSPDIPREGLYVILGRVSVAFRSARPFVEPSDEDILEKLQAEGLSPDDAYRGLKLIRSHPLVPIDDD